MGWEGKAGKTREENKERDGGYYWLMKLHMTAADRDLKTGPPQSTHVAFKRTEPKDVSSRKESHPNI
ncbi:unnamed protein product [Prunus armeniaca]|uniref:Uncharacterized protein n=1 Tax=Prunus armeniaca TaxID=36596 RepID=A0A6J5UAI1_PRUAR|nr:unnamed protein product [Prunus armeniaca]CAB4303734.1 unnamed protein product [Prunus armeniaca]